MKLALVVVLMAALVLTGCFAMPSLNSLATNDTLTSEPKLVGVWRDMEGPERLIVEADGSGYQAIWVPRDAATVRYGVQLTKLDKLLVADVVPSESTGNIPGHTFATVEIAGNELRIGFLDSEWLRSLVVERKVAHMMEKDGPVLLATSDEIRRFLIETATDSRAIQDKVKLVRVQ